jgi:hypothetical protein
VSSTLRQVYELHELNVELMDTLLLIGKRLIEYADKYQIPIEGRANLASLIGRAQRILEEIGTPYNRNPVVSDAILHPKPSDEDFTEPTVWALLHLRDTRFRGFVLLFGT